MSDYGNNITKDHDDFNEKKLVYYHLPVIKSVNQLLEILQLSETDEKKFFYSRNRKLFYIIKLIFLKGMEIIELLRFWIIE